MGAQQNKLKLDPRLPQAKCSMLEQKWNTQFLEARKYVWIKTLKDI